MPTYIFLYLYSQ